MVLAAFVAVRGDPFLAALDALGALVVPRRVAGGDVRAGGDPAIGVGDRDDGAPGRSKRPSRARPAAVGADAAGTTVGSVAADPGAGAAARCAALLLAAPDRADPVLLFASADPIFRRGSSDLLGCRSISGASRAGPVRRSPAPGWRPACCRSRRVGIPAVERSSLGAAARTGVAGPGPACSGRPRRWSSWPSSISSSALFVGLQIAYLFGGLDTLVAAGMTYSDYARRGFFELVAAACLAGAVVVALETTVAAGRRPYLAGAPRAHGSDRGRARLGRAPAPAVPGRLRLDGAPAVRPR